MLVTRNMRATLTISYPNPHPMIDVTELNMMDRLPTVYIKDRLAYGKILCLLGDGSGVSTHDESF